MELGAFSYGDKVGLMTGPATYTGMGSNDYVLPSLNVTFEHAENRVIKFAASKTIARPALSKWMFQYLLLLHLAGCILQH